MKKIVVLLLCSVIIIFLAFIVFANFGVNSETKSLENYISDKNISEIIAVDSLGDLVDSEEIKNKLFECEYGQVNNLLKENNLFLVYSEEIIKHQIYDISSDVKREFVTGYYGYDIENRRAQEWITSMSVSYMKNSDGTLTAQGNPNISVYANFGSAWNIKVNNIRTGYSYKNSGEAIEFYGNYRLNATFGTSLGSKLDYGTIHVSNIVTW
ncbi:hypothetical protein [Tissierella praeacuta]|uniref:hypothetical protein n=1 Tax=Tissierella praeacuta TaxID=43131 RepID=UPI003341415E